MYIMISNHVGKRIKMQWSNVLHPDSICSELGQGLFNNVSVAEHHRMVLIYSSFLSTQALYNIILLYFFEIFHQLCTLLLTIISLVPPRDSQNRELSVRRKHDHDAAISNNPIIIHYSRVLNPKLRAYILWTLWKVYQQSL